MSEISFLIRGLRFLKLPSITLLNILTSCALLHVLYSSPTVFSGVLEKGLHTLMHSIGILANSRGCSVPDQADAVIRMHLAAYEHFANIILSDS